MRQNRRATSSEWLLNVWNRDDRLRHAIALKKNNPMISCSYQGKRLILDNPETYTYSAMLQNITTPKMCVQIFHVSVCMRNIEPKHLWNDCIGGRYPCLRYSLSFSQLGRLSKDTTFQTQAGMSCDSVLSTDSTLDVLADLLWPKPSAFSANSSASTSVSILTWLSLGLRMRYRASLAM